MSISKKDHTRKPGLMNLLRRQLTVDWMKFIFWNIAIDFPNSFYFNYDKNCEPGMNPVMLKFFMEKGDFYE